VIERIRDPRLVPPAGLYSHATVVSAHTDLVFIAGQLAVAKAGEPEGIPPAFTDQFRMVFLRLGDVLDSSGSTFGDVVKFTTYLATPADIPSFYEERATLFSDLYPGGDYPPNTLLVVDQLVDPRFLIEIEAVAARRSR
jgi:enamine deaminase RidA (YjgF/YER057c/UK114 family)